VLAKAEREGSLREKIRFLCRFALLIVDEIGYLPVTPGAEICSSNSSTHATKKAP
jgi:DNA replication protein DnaC